MSIELNPADDNSTYLTLNSVAATMASSPGIHTFTCWVKGFKASDYLMSVGTTSANNSAAHAYMSGTETLAIRSRAGGTDGQVTDTIPTSAWYLLGARFSTNVGFLAYENQVKVSTNGADFSTSVANGGTSVAIDNLTLGAASFASSVFGYADSIKFAYPAVWSGELSSANIDLLYGSGPSAGDAYAPWLVDTDNLIHAASFKDGTLTQGTGTVGTAWTMVGGDFTAHDDDNPSLIESLGTGHRRRRYGPMARH